MRSAAVAAALLVGAIVLCSPRAAGSTPDNSSVHSSDQGLVRAADELDHAAAATRTSLHTKVRPPDVSLSVPLRSLTRAQPALAHWLESELTHINSEKSAKVRSSELKELAASVRRAAQPGVGFAPAKDPRGEAVVILAQRAYQTGGAGPAPAPHETLMERIMRWLAALSSRIFYRIFQATASVPIIGQIISFLFIALLAGAAAYLIFVIVMIMVRRRRPSLTDEGAPLQERLEPDRLYQLGMAAASDGRYAQAVSLLFQASLASLDRTGKLPYDGSLTAGEYRRAVRRAVSAASPHFDDLARAFVLAAFAQRPISKDDFAAADVAYRSLGTLLAST